MRGLLQNSNRKRSDIREHRGPEKRGDAPETKFSYAKEWLRG